MNIVLQLSYLLVKRLYVEWKDQKFAFSTSYEVEKKYYSK